MHDAKLFLLLIFYPVLNCDAFSNKCLYTEQILNREGPRTFNCSKFVIDSTDEIWNKNKSEEWVTEKVQEYMSTDWQSISVYGQYIQGVHEATKLVLETLEAFPDIRLHIVDTFCEGNDVDGYKTTMPVIHTATHLGWHPVLGAPTGKTLKWAGIPNCFIKNINGRWKYTAEINIPDAYSLYTQLGVDPPHPEVNLMVLNDCEQIFDWKTGSLNPKFVPSL